MKKTLTIHALAGVALFGLGLTTGLVARGFVGLSDAKPPREN